jgi:hypothetical protein
LIQLKSNVYTKEFLVILINSLSVTFPPPYSNFALEILNATSILSMLKHIVGDYALIKVYTAEY